VKRATFPPILKQDMSKVFLHTGDCFLAVQPTLVTTVLGSCVAVTMCSPRRGIGAICHAFLPESAEFDCDRDPQPCRYVDTAVENMLSGLGRLGVARHELEIKVFGGASGMAGHGADLSGYDIGRRNQRAVDRALAAAGLTASRRDVGGRTGRKLHFVAHTGEVWLKRLDALSSAVAQRRITTCTGGD
jgi:chemotaxis protein CheD